MGTIQIATQKPASSGKASTTTKTDATIKTSNNKPANATLSTNTPDVESNPSKVDFLLSRMEFFASSYGLQPYKVLVIKDAETKRKLQSAGWNQQLLGGQSQLVVLAINKEITKERIDSYISEIAGKKKVSAYSFLSYKKYLESNINHRDKEGKNWSAKQAFLAVDNLLAAAVEVDVKATVVEGPDMAHLDELLGLTARKMHTAAAVVLQGGTGAGPKAPFSKAYRVKELLEYI